jgi:hypothetical protein
VERFDRTIKEKMWRYFTFEGTYKYIDVLQDLVFSYNNSYHRSIKEKPINVSTKNEDKIFLNLYGHSKNESDEYIAKFNFKEGDNVRISKTKTLFAKGYTQNWTIEIFEINKCLMTNPPSYKLNDKKGELIKGVFYEPELQLVKKFDDEYEIEKILKTRTKDGKKEYFVSWKGYPESMNSWVKNIKLTK